MSSSFRALFARSGNPRRPLSARPWIETLEDRAVPAITTPMAGNPGPVTVTGTTGADQFVIRLKAGDPTTIQVSDNNGSSFTNVAVSDATRITVNGLAGDDTLTIDESNGLIGNGLTAGLPISFAGGSGTDKLVLSGSPAGAAVNETYNIGSTTGSGSIVIGNGTASSTVTLTGLEGVTDTLTAATLTINGTDQRDVLRLVNGATAGGVATFRLESIFTEGRSLLRQHHFNDEGEFEDEDEGGDDNGQDARGDDKGGGDDRNGNNGNHFGELKQADLDNFFGSMAVPFTFGNKGAVTINLKGGNDFLVINTGTTAAAGLTSLTVNGGSGFDVVANRGLASSVTASFPQVERVLTSLDQIFIEELYQLRLNRFGDDGGEGNWMGVLHGRGRRDVLNGILRSDEALGVLVNDLYVKLLGRTADQSGLNSFVNLLRNGGSLEQVITSIATSPEFLNRVATLGFTGTQQEQVIRALYQDLLNRPATDQEVANAVAAQNVSGIAAVVNGIVTSPEFRRLEVTSLYQALFDRLPDLPGLNGWVNSALNLLSIRLGMLDSDEAFGHS